MEHINLTLKAASVVRVLLEDPSRPRYQYELQRAAGLPSGTVYPVLVRLVAAGWVTRERDPVRPGFGGQGRRTYYRLVPEAVPVARERLAAIGAEFGMPETPQEGTS